MAHGSWQVAGPVSNNLVDDPPTHPGQDTRKEKLVHGEMSKVVQRARQKRVPSVHRIRPLQHEALRLIKRSGTKLSLLRETSDCLWIGPRWRCCALMKTTASEHCLSNTIDNLNHKPRPLGATGLLPAIWYAKRTLNSSIRNALKWCSSAFPECVDSFGTLTR
jgi:hypothetical protein